MRILPIANTSYAQKNQQPSFKTKFIKSATLEKAFVNAEKQSCEKFLDAVTNLSKDRLNRTVELTSGVFFSKDGTIYTKTKLISEGKEQEMVGFPNLYGIEPEESIGNDARLLIVNFAKGYHYNKAAKTPEEIKEGIKELKKQILK